jgi:hypothetical protein
MRMSNEDRKTLQRVFAAERKAKKLAADARINRAVCGFIIPMMSIPPLYRLLEAEVAAGKSDDDLKAAVAAFPGIKPSLSPPLDI